MTKSLSRKLKPRKSPLRKRSRSKPRKSPLRKRSRSRRRKSKPRKSPLRKRSSSRLRKSKPRKSPLRKRYRSRSGKSHLGKNYSPTKRRKKHTGVKGSNVVVKPRRSTKKRKKYTSVKEGNVVVKPRRSERIEMITSPDIIGKKLQKFVNSENKELLEKIYTDYLSDKQIYEIFTILFPPLQDFERIDTNNITGCFLVSGHGREGYKKRPKIINAIIQKFENKTDKKALKEYINSSVFMIMAMGMIAVSSPMERERKIETGFGFREGYTTSELDIVIPKTFFSIFDKYNNDNRNKIFLNDEQLDLFHSLIKSQLRLNFRKIWSEPSPIAIDPDEDRQLYEVIKRKEFWVLKKLTSESLERSYFLSPNKKEDPTFFAHEGLHLIGIRDMYGGMDTPYDEMTREKMFKELMSRLPTAETITKLKDKFLLKTDKRELTKQEQIFNKIMHEIKSGWLDLSTIIMLGYILDIKKLYIYDPACRPLYKGKEIQITSGPTVDESLKRVPSY